MNIRTAIVWTCLILSAHAAVAQPQDRVWPYFRHPGVVVEPGKPLPAGLRLQNGSIELRLKKDDARVSVLGKDGQQLVHATVKRPAGTHVVVVWGENIPHYQPWVYLDGKNMIWDERSRSAGKEPKPEIWRQSPPATIALEGEADQLRVYPYSMTEPELANAYAHAAGRDMAPLAPVHARFDYRMSIGRLNVLLDVRADFGQATGAKVTFQGPEKPLQALVRQLDGGAGPHQLRACSRPGSSAE